MPLCLLVSYSGAMGGAERALLDFAGGLDGQMCLSCPEGAMAAAARARGFTVLTPAERPLELRGSAPMRVAAAKALATHGVQTRRLIRDVDPDLVVLSGMRSGIAGLLWGRCARPVAFLHHDLVPGRFIGALVRVAARRAAAIVVPSEAVARDLDPGRGLEGSVAVVHPGVDLECFPVTDRASSMEVLVLGAIVEWKRPDLALEACALARRRLPGLRLALAGAPLGAGGEVLLGALRARAARGDLAGAVEFAGRLDDPADALARAACMLHCAPREPFGIAVLEALAAGRPAVVPAAAGPAEIVDQSCGVLYEPGDPIAAADALVSLLSDPDRAAALGAAGRRRANEHFGLRAARRQFAAAVSPAMREPRDAVRAATEDLAIVTVTHNSSATLERLLASIDRHLPGAQVIVADCASDDDSLAVAGAHPCAVPVALEENVGFGRGCNAAIASVRAPVTALLNPDVELVDDSLLGLADALHSGGHARPRLLAPLVLNRDGSRQDTAHPLPTSAPDLARSLIPPSFVPGRAREALEPWRARLPRRIGWAVGCALVAGTDTLRALGPFDERIFLYGEDLDLGLRAAAAGVETWFWPQARVVHDQSHSTAAAFDGEPFERLARARRDVVVRRLGSRRARLDDAAQALTFGSRIALKGLAGRPVARERRQLRALARART